MTPAGLDRHTNRVAAIPRLRACLRGTRARVALEPGRAQGPLGPTSWAAPNDGTNGAGHFFNAGDGRQGALMITFLLALFLTLAGEQGSVTQSEQGCLSESGVIWLVP